IATVKTSQTNNFRVANLAGSGTVTIAYDPSSTKNADITTVFNSQMTNFTGNIAVGAGTGTGASSTGSNRFYLDWDLGAGRSITLNNYAVLMNDQQRTLSGNITTPNVYTQNANIVLAGDNAW